LDARGLPNPPVVATDNERLLACLAYLSQIALPAVLPVLLIVNRSTKQSGFVRHHAVQAIALVVVGIIYDLLLALTLLSFREQAQAVLVFVLTLMLVPPVGVTFYYASCSVRGRWTEVPVVTNLLKDWGIL